MAERAVLVAFVGALLGLDNIAVGQFMFAQPVVGAVLMGYLVGEPLLGIWAALTFQLLWAGQLPVGAYVPPNAAMTAIAAVGLAAPGAGPFTSRAVAAAALAVPVGIVAGRLDVWVKSRNIVILHRAENDILDDKPFALGGAIIKGVANFFLVHFALLAVAVFVGAALVTGFLPFVGEAGHKALRMVFWASPAVGVGAAMATYGGKRHALAFAGGALVAVVAAVTLARLT